MEPKSCERGRLNVSQAPILPTPQGLSCLPFGYRWLHKAGRVTHNRLRCVLQNKLNRRIAILDRTETEEDTWSRGCIVNFDVYDREVASD